MLGGGSITLFHVRGIRIAVDWSWFIVLFLVIVWLSGFYGDVLGQSSSSTEAYALAVASAMGFFGSILLHELGHAYFARREGIGISSIQLWIFGGVARMERESESPAAEFKVAIGGPLVTLAIALVLCAIGVARRRGRRLQGRDAGRRHGRHLRVAGDGRLAGLDQPPRPRLQPAPRLPDGRRADRPRDRLVAHRGPGLGDPVRSHPGAGLRLSVHRRRASSSSSPATSSAASGWR